MDLCVEGFESSANSFMVNVFRRLRSDLRIAHHTHSVANLKRSRQYDVPTVVLFRDPVDAIPSLVSRFRPGLHEAVLRYIRFYRDVCGHMSEVFLVGFEEATSDFERVIRRFEMWSGLTFGTFNPEEVEHDVIRHIEEWSREREQEEEMSLPVEKREEHKAQLREKLRTVPSFQRTTELFRTLHQARRRQNEALK